MPYADRILDLARAIISHRLHASDVPVYDRAAVQEVILQWWLQRRPPRRATSIQAVLPENDPALQ